MSDLLTQAIDKFFYILYIIILFRILLSWFPGAGRGPIGALVRSITDPILVPVQIMVDKSPIGGTMVGFSAVIALFMMNVVEVILCDIVIAIF